jgi:hypothetical protein
VDGIYIDITRQNCRAQDEANDNSFYKKNFNISAGFLVFFIAQSHVIEAARKRTKDNGQLSLCHGRRTKQ